MPPSQHPVHLGARLNAILLALSGHERHGYDLMHQIALDSDGHLPMGPATLYTSLKRLVEMGLIVESEPRDEPGQARRRYYRLTDSGAAALKAELERSERFATLLRGRLA
jgi:DNA-binding PadR family transcriptional regulator